MEEVRNIIGFNTPSKVKAIVELREASQQEDKVQEEAIDLIDKLREETELRINSLKSIITTDEYNKYEPLQKNQILLDFTYYLKISDILL